jgi:hypothetical protein
LRRLEQRATLHRSNEVQHGSAGAAREAVENVAHRIHVKSVVPVATVNGAAAPILLFSTPSKLDLVVPKHRFHIHAALDPFEI